jgi:hypothetical protein
MMKVPSYRDVPWNCPEMARLSRGPFSLLLVKTLKRGTMRLFRSLGPQKCPCTVIVWGSSNSEVLATVAILSFCSPFVKSSVQSWWPSRLRGSSHAAGRVQHSGHRISQKPVRNCTKSHLLALAVEARGSTNCPLRGHRRFREDCLSIYN